MRIARVAAFGLLLTIASTAHAQQGTASLRGRVLDEQGGVLPGVTVVVTNQGSGVFREVVSNEDGSYFVTGIVPGPYVVRAELTGFKRYERPDVVLEVGRTATLDVTLSVGVLEETITVTTEAPLIDLTSQAVGGNISRGELTEIPNATRNWLGFVGLLPGIQVQSTTISFGGDSINVNGQSNRNNNFVVDGGGNNDDYLGQAFGGQTRVALEAVQEFQVLTNQFDAEFGRSTGAVVNAVTKQGSNQIRGSAFGYFTDSAITAPDFFTKQAGLKKPDTSKQEWGGTVGGPIVKDKAHYFGSLERVSIDDGRSNTFAVRPELDYSIPQRTRVWNFMLRFDHQVNKDNTWGVRYLQENSPTFDQISGRWALAAKREEADVDRTTVGTWNTVFSNNTFNTVRMSYTYEDNIFASPEFFSGTPQADRLPTLQMLTFRDQQTPDANERINKSLQVDESFSWYVPEKLGGDHDMKFGVQFIFADARINDQTNANGTFVFSTDLAFDPNNPRTYPERLQILVPGPESTYMSSKVIVGFAQDKYQRGNLTLNLGARYDVEIIPLRNRNNPFLPDEGYPVDRNNIAPRLGFAYNPGGTGKGVIRGGYGLFYDKVHLTIIDEFLRRGVFASTFTASFPNDRADAGPSQGRLPADPFLVNGPTVNRALLAAQFPPGTLGRNTGDVFLDNPDRRVPFTHQVTIGYQRQLLPQVSAGIDYIKTWGRDMFIYYNLNPSTRANTSRTGALAYSDTFGIADSLGLSAFRNRVFTIRNDAKSDYDGLNVQIEKRYSHNWSARVSYALSSARGNTEASGTDFNRFQVGPDANLDLNQGPLPFDRRHNLVFSGRLEFPWIKGLTLSGTTRWMSGQPLWLYDSSTDADRNGELFDSLPAGTYSGTGQNAFTADNTGGRHGARGPTFKQTDARFGYRLRPGKDRTLDFFLEVFNLFNNTNFENPTGDRRLADFLVLTALRGGGFPRQAQLGARLGF
ncbi:MAG: carboxypeptidase regulatory-like domain-containing protein [Vicinamibacterales bacterium]